MTMFWGAAAAAAPTKVTVLNSCSGAEKGGWMGPGIKYVLQHEDNYSGKNFPFVKPYFLHCVSSLGTSSGQ